MPNIMVRNIVDILDNAVDISCHRVRLQICPKLLSCTRKISVTNIVPGEGLKSLLQKTKKEEKQL